MTQFQHSDGFDTVLSFILSVEGGYVNDPRDPGGETKYGISKRSFPDVDIKNLTIDQAAEIYRQSFWNPLHLSQFPPELGAVIFDTAVNMGKRRATVLLQKTLNETTMGPTLVVDGVLGPKTQAVVNAFCQQGATYTQNLCLEYLIRRLNRYAKLATSKKFRPFLLGWLKRVARLWDSLG
ncbi:glycoside hydrolase family 108 protein [Desulfovibrio inopinatus]|uniref:glycoside hydrolase family 108 protein n=1 Tax=Desulfovibrio inopinatus TaxID=102109 RepID=UPI00040EF23A|nr:glycosyl hydrolase 108 family protein [Desulfovibrio inopinatus]